MELFLFLDFDGTLTPIDPAPYMTVLARGTKDALRALARHPRCRVAIVSGRALKDLKKRVGIRGIIYAGNHGFEIDGPGISYKVPVRRATRLLLERLLRELRSSFGGVSGVLIEDKGATLTFHYRMVAQTQVPALKRAFLGFIRPFARSGEIRLHAGKEVFEMSAPVDWDKGRAVRYILSRRRAKNVLPVYIGDDLNDVAAFKEIDGKGLTVCVGKKRGIPAQFFVRDTAEVVELLRRLTTLLS